MSSGRALVLFSGGQDSTVCLAWALRHFDGVETVGFDYGQRHAAELTQRVRILDRLTAMPAFAGKLGADTVLRLPALGEISDTALTRDTEIAFASSGLPTTFVPGRNVLFLSYAAALAYRRGMTTLVGGMCETDFSGYPDCRRASLDALETALSLGLDRPIKIETPLMAIDKAGTWALGQELGGDALTALIAEESHTCYLGDRSKRHAWGYGCGTCPACELRAKGWETWNMRRAR